MDGEITVGGDGESDGQRVSTKVEPKPLHAGDLGSIPQAHGAEHSWATPKQTCLK